MDNEETIFEKLLRPSYFLVACFIAMVTGLCLGLMFRIVFAPYHLSAFQMVQIIFVLVATCTAIAVVFHKLHERMQNPEEFLESFKSNKEDDK
jgi:hypothetical protein